MRLTQNDNYNDREYLMTLLVTAVFAAFMVWANYTRLDLVKRGDGRVIADGQNKNVQSSERGTIATYLVEEGSAVNAGQIIATINAIEAEGVLEELETRLSNLRLKMIRLDAELNGGTIASVRNNANGYTNTLLDAEIELMSSRRKSLNAEFKTLNQDKKRKGKVLLGLGAEIEGQNSLKVLLNREMFEVLPLVDAGVLLRAERFRLEREDVSIKTQLHVLSEKVAQTELEIEQISHQLQSVQLNYNTEVYQERSQVISEITELEVRLPAIRQRLKETEIRSPIDGIVNRVFFNSLGAVVSSGEVIAEIVPTKGKLLIEAFIDPKDIATIEPGQPAKISLTAYDPSKYGYLLGTLTKVSADTVFREETQSSAYSVNLSIDTEIFESNNIPVSIVPGMIAQVDIIRGERTILEYFWQPIAKMKDTAFRE
ncbi:MAG: HlyD family type I secretion periplasmic adaptor subunit [Pseudomonadales bacterium]|tara:strand:+ start:1157 stop:2440 length:1284 start_codon:yes stop_codon:yes gene_type:complete